MHLVIDGYRGNPEKLQDVELLRSFLITYPAAIGMTRITEPMLLTYSTPDNVDWGVTGFVIIAESHISLHTFPNRGYVNLDIFSCKGFDAEKATQDVKELLGLQEVRSWILERGLEHFRPPMRELEVLRMAAAAD